MSYAAVDGQVLFWFVVALTLLLLVFIGAVVWTHPGAVGSPQSHELDLPPPRPPSDLPLPVRRPPAVVLAGAAARSVYAGHGPGRAGATASELTAVRRPYTVGGPPWSPAPEPPGLAGWDAAQPFAVPGQVPGKPGMYRVSQPDASLLPRTAGTFHMAGRTSLDPNSLRSTRIVQGRVASGSRTGAHRRESRGGAHRAGTSSGRAAGSAGRAGRHRAGVR